MCIVRLAKVVFAGYGQEWCSRLWMHGPGCLGREAWVSPENAVAGWRSCILRHSRHSQHWRQLKVVPMWGGLNSSRLYSTGNPWSKRIDARGP